MPGIAIDAPRPGSCLSTTTTRAPGAPAPGRRRRPRCPRPPRRCLQRTSCFADRRADGAASRDWQRPARPATGCRESPGSRPAAGTAAWPPCRPRWRAHRTWPERSAMHHGWRDLDARGPAIDEQPARLALQRRHQRPRGGRSASSRCSVAVSWPSSRSATSRNASSLPHCTTSEAAPNTSSCKRGSARKSSARATNRCAWP